MWKKYTAPLIGLGLLLATAGSSFASGFALIEQSVSGLGNAFAGGAASAEDASTVFFNPAGMLLLEGQQAIAATHVIAPSTKFKAETATSVGGAVSLGTNNGGDGGVTGVAPNLYYVNKVTDTFAFGIGINAPFGLATEYDKDWVGRYHAVESDVMTININPSLAIKFTDKFSFGIGINAQYIEATLSSMVDGGLVAVGLGGAAAPSDPDNDIFVENNADDWSYGYNLGMLYEFSESTRLGFAYRSQVSHELEGDTKISMADGIAATLDGIDIIPGFVTGLDLFPAAQGVNGEITLPASASLSFFHQFNDQLSIMADISWTEWSSFDELTLNFEGVGVAGSDFTTTTENWDDTWRYALGVTYKFNEKFQLRSGVAFDETPIPDEHRTPRIPGEDRLWVALGCGYQATENLALDFAYAHLFVDDSEMDLDSATSGHVAGEFENSVDIASISLSYNF